MAVRWDGTGLHPLLACRLSLHVTSSASASYGPGYDENGESNEHGREFAVPSCFDSDLRRLSIRSLMCARGNTQSGSSEGSDAEDHIISEDDEVEEKTHAEPIAKSNSHTGVVAVARTGEVVGETDPDEVAKREQVVARLVVTKAAALLSAALPQPRLPAAKDAGAAKAKPKEAAECAARKTFLPGPAPMDVPFGTLLTARLAEPCATSHKLVDATSAAASAPATACCDNSGSCTASAAPHAAPKKADEDEKVAGKAATKETTKDEESDSEDAPKGPMYGIGGVRWEVIPVVPRGTPLDGCARRQAVPSLGDARTRTQNAATPYASFGPDGDVVRLTEASALTKAARVAALLDDFALRADELQSATGTGSGLSSKNGCGLPADVAAAAALASFRASTFAAFPAPDAAAKFYGANPLGTVMTHLQPTPQQQQQRKGAAAPTLHTSNCWLPAWPAGLPFPFPEQSYCVDAEHVGFCIRASALVCDLSKPGCPAVLVPVQETTGPEWAAIGTRWAPAVVSTPFVRVVPPQKLRAMLPLVERRAQFGFQIARVHRFLYHGPGGVVVGLEDLASNSTQGAGGPEAVVVRGDASLTSTPSVTTAGQALQALRNETAPEATGSGFAEWHRKVGERLAAQGALTGGAADSPPPKPEVIVVPPSTSVSAGADGCGFMVAARRVVGGDGAGALPRVAFRVMAVPGEGSAESGVADSSDVVPLFEGAWSLVDPAGAPLVCRISPHDDVSLSLHSPCAPLAFMQPLAPAAASATRLPPSVAAAWHDISQSLTSDMADRCVGVTVTFRSRQDRDMAALALRALCE